MAILFCGIVMSHYTHFNVSTITQITMQQTLRTLAFIAETCVFAYLGLALFSFKHQFQLPFVIWSVILCLISRALNIFPLAYLVNKFREHQITRKMMFIMWFSGMYSFFFLIFSPFTEISKFNEKLILIGLRGAISYALSMHLDFSSDAKKAKDVIITTTLIIVLITTLVFGGSTLPLLKYLQESSNELLITMNAQGASNGSVRKVRRNSEVTLSKTKEWGKAIDSEHLSEIADDEIDGSFMSSRQKGFAKWDMKYFVPFFTRRFTQEVCKNFSILESTKT